VDIDKKAMMVASTFQRMCDAMVKPRAYPDDDVFTASSPMDVLDALDWVRLNLSHTSFIDVGCGIAWIPAMATDLGFAPAVGIDHNKEIVQLSNDLGFPAVWQDAFGLDYSKYDVIYLFRPIMNKEFEDTLECKIADEMQVGAIAITLGSNWNRIITDPRFNTIAQFGYIYLSQKLKA
jgi:SAM-dependent methyltransferase